MDPISVHAVHSSLVVVNDVFYKRLLGLADIVDVIFIGLFVDLVLLKLLTLNDSAEDGKEDDKGEVEVEPAVNVINSAGFELFSKSEFVGVTSGVEGNSTDEQVGAGEGSCEDDHGVKEEEGHHSTDEGTKDSGDPEEYFTVG